MPEVSPIGQTPEKVAAGNRFAESLAERGGGHAPSPHRLRAEAVGCEIRVEGATVIATACSSRMARRLAVCLNVLHGVRFPGLCGVGDCEALIKAADRLAATAYDALGSKETGPSRETLRRRVAKLRAASQAYTWTRGPFEIGPRRKPSHPKKREEE